MTRFKVAFFLMFAAVAGLAGWWFYASTLADRLDRLYDNGQIRVEQLVVRLEGQLEPYRVLINLLARDPEIHDFLLNKDNQEEINNLLTRQALTYGAEGITLVDEEGQAIASYSLSGSTNRDLTSYAFASSGIGELGLARARRNGQRYFIFRRGILLDDGRYRGAVLLSIEAADLEYQWAFTPEPIGFLDDENTVFLSNRPSLLLKSFDREQGAGPSGSDANSHGRLGLRAQRLGDRGEHTIWSFPTTPDLPEHALIIEQTSPKLRLKTIGFVDVTPARAAAAKSANLAYAVTMLIFLGFLLLINWRNRTAERLSYENKAKKQLEDKVQERTQELLDTQTQLLRATKMTVLGQMSAGISHEVNQPLATIAALAENGEKFLDLEKSAEVRDNLKSIGEQTRRINRIIRSLREFAHEGDVTLDVIDVVDCLKGVLHLITAETQKANIALHVDHPDHPLFIRGGMVRLQQVIMNIAANAMDAMSGQSRGHLCLHVCVEQGMVLVEIIDSGPGVAEPERVFDPFYTTKELGASKGLGLGLSISYGIIRSFGGSVSAENRPEGGAVFQIILPLVDPKGAPAGQTG